MRYQTLLFDLDGTLMDFDRSEQQALQKTFLEHGYPFDQNTNAVYQRINRALWAQLEKGEVDRQTLCDVRFDRLFSEVGIEGDGKAFNAEYLNNLGLGYFLMPHAKEVVARLSAYYPLYVVTNGITKTQQRRMAGTGLGRYFQRVFVSEEIGYQKPMAAFFDAVFAELGEDRRANSVIIGDSLSSDIQGGNNANIATVWFNPAGKENNLGVTVSHEIRDLRELYGVLDLPPL